MSLRGEVFELKKKFGERDVHKDLEKQYRLLSQTIELMTTGFDVSKLFNEIILYANTTDIRNKKLVYQYITNYANTHPKESLLIINTLVKDCEDSSPIIRGLALRNVSSLNIANIETHCLPLIKNGLKDQNSYVRKIAVIAVAKIFRFRNKDYEYIEKEKLLESLHSALKDKDPSVTINALQVLDEIENPLKVERKIVFYMLNRIKFFSSWQLATVLRFIRRYTPKEKKEVFDIMNILDAYLQLNNSALVAAIFDVFLKFSRSMPKIHTKVYQRLSDPLLLFLKTGAFELQHVLLKHVQIICERSPQIFREHYKSFYLLTEEPEYVQRCKLKVLELITYADNLSAVFTELLYYIHSFPNEIGKASISVMGTVLMTLPSRQDVEGGLSYIVELLDTPEPRIISSVFGVLKNVLRKYENEDFSGTYIPTFVEHWQHALQDSESKIGLLWVLGRYGDILDKSPYILEYFIDHFNENENEVKHQILNTAMMLFFRRPPEIQRMLGRLLSTNYKEETQDVDIQERCFYFYKLLKLDVEMARKVILGGETEDEEMKGQKMTLFIEEKNPEYVDRMYSEFNTLSIVFRKHSSEFVRNQDQKILGRIVDDDEEEKESEDEETSSDEDDEDGSSGLELDEDDEDEGGLYGGGTGIGKMKKKKKKDKVVENPAPGVEFSDTTKKLTPQVYQKYWMGNAPGKDVVIMISQKFRTINEIVKYLNPFGVRCLAKQPRMVYLYAQLKVSSDYVLVQLFYNPSLGQIKCTIRGEVEEKKMSVIVTYFSGLFEKFT